MIRWQKTIRYIGPCLSGVVILALLCWVVNAAEAPLARRLAWTEDPSLVCGGYFSEPVSIARVPKPGAPLGESTTITAKGPTLIQPDGTSVLQDHVLLTQPGRMVWADRALIDRDKRSASITRVRLYGHVRIMEHGRLVVADRAMIFLG